MIRIFPTFKEAAIYPLASLAVNTDPSAIFISVKKRSNFNNWPFETTLYLKYNSLWPWVKTQTQKWLDQALNSNHTSSQVLISLLPAKQWRYVQKCMQSRKSNLPISFLRAFFGHKWYCGRQASERNILVRLSFCSIAAVFPSSQQTG